MRTADLTTDQLNKLLIAIADRRDFFARLKERMDAVGWDQTDLTYLAVVAARDAAHAIAMSMKPGPHHQRQKCRNG